MAGEGTFGHAGRRQPANVRAALNALSRRLDSKPAAASPLAGPLLVRQQHFVARAGPWVQARGYVRAVSSDLPERNGWTIARHQPPLRALAVTGTVTHRSRGR